MSIIAKFNNAFNLKLIFNITEWLRYYWHADSIYNTHSPFLYDLAEKVFSEDTKNSSHFFAINTLRNKLCKNKINISINDLGAGSKVIKSNSRSIAEITKSTAIPAKYGRLLYRLIEWGNCENALELGTCMGISTAYMAAARNGTVKINSIEGDATIQAKAKENLAEIKMDSNIEFHLGNFDKVLLAVLNQMKQVDFVLLDGNHKKDATLRYFNQILPYLHKNSIVVLDDIRWSKDMLEAWEIIKKNKEVTCSIDLFRIGLLFFKKELLKPQHISYKY